MAKRLAFTHDFRETGQRAFGDCIETSRLQDVFPTRTPRTSDRRSADDMPPVEQGRNKRAVLHDSRSGNE